MERISVLIPDMPTTVELMPWLDQIERNHWYTNFGPLNTEFEKQLLDLFHSPCPQYLTTVSSGTLGLELALQALHLKRDAQVLIPGLTFPASATAIVRAGLTPLFADVDADSWLLTPEIARKALSKHAFSAVMPVASFGCSQETSAWDQFSEETDIPVIIDAAGAIGNQNPGKKTTLVFSLHATKALSAGEGGFVLSPDLRLIEKIKVASNFGMGELPAPRMIRYAGTNAKLSEYHAAVGLAALQNWDKHQRQRRQLFHFYVQALEELKEHIIFQKGTSDIVHTLLTLRFPEYDDVALLQDKLNQAGIMTLRWYYPPLPLHLAFSDYETIDSLENIKSIAPQLLGLPFHLHLKEFQISFIRDCLTNILEKKLVESCSP